MASPQTENGFTQIANELLDALCRIRIAGEPRQCLGFIIRKTYGYNKKEDAIPLSQFCLATGLCRPSVCRAIKQLLAMNLINKNATSSITKYRFNKDFDTWKPLTKTLHSSNNANKGVAKVLIPVSNNVTLNRQSSIDNSKDNNAAPVKEIVGYLNEKTGKNFRATTKTYIAHITARWKEGYRFNDFKKVVDTKLKDPHFIENPLYLRPETLFGTKFGSYLNQNNKNGNNGTGKRRPEVCI